MASRKISLLLSDVDGTLVTHDKILTERAKEAVHGLRRAGIRFAITSGRAPRGMAMFIEPLAIDTPISGFNGGMVVRPDFTLIEERDLAPDVAREALAIVEKHGLSVWVFSGEDWLVRDLNGPHVGFESAAVQFHPKAVADFGPALDKATKVVGVSDDFARVKACEAETLAGLKSEVSATRSQPHYLDITHPDANKGSVVDHLSRAFGIPEQEIATIGDGPNDVLMFKRSGYSIAMGNASDDVKAAASAVTDSNEDEGFAKAIERYLL